MAPRPSALRSLEALAPRFGEAHSTLEKLRRKRIALIQQGLRDGHTEREVATAARVSPAYVHEIGKRR